MTGSQTRCSLCHNSPPTGKDELARAPTKCRGIPALTTILPAFKTQTLTLAPDFASTPAFFVGTYTNVNLQRAIKLALK